MSRSETYALTSATRKRSIKNLRNQRMFADWGEPNLWLAFMGLATGLHPHKCDLYFCER